MLRFGKFIAEQLIVEGGNVEVNGVSAKPIDLTKEDRTKSANDVKGALHDLNKSFHKEHGKHLFGPKGEAIEHGGAFAGSTHAFMNKDISDEEHNTHKKKVGDLDIMVPSEHKDDLHKHLQPGKKFGKYTLVGTKKSGAQIHALMKHENGQVHQFDFEPAQFDKHTPSDWSKFSHSSNWNDTKSGVKGVFHKLALSSLTAAHGAHGIVRDKKGDKEQFIEKHAFSVDRGMRERHKQVGEDEHGRPIVHEVPTKDSTYTTHLPTVFHNLLGKHPEGNDMEHFGSYHGLLHLAKNHLSKEQQGRVADKFIHTLYSPNRAQMLGSSQKDDEAMKDHALGFMKKAFPHHFDKHKEDQINKYKEEFYQKHAQKMAKLV